MKRICVFAGSNVGSNPGYLSAARDLGEELARCQIELVYGGSNVGLMGEVANAVLELGGSVIGVMPKGLFRSEIVHTNLTELIEVKDMHERKATMNKLSDAFVSLPGGYGTLEELFEVVSWAQIGIHSKPIGLYNVAAFYDPLLELVNHAVRAGFVKETHKEVLLSAASAKELLQKLADYRPPTMDLKWDQLK